MENSSESLTPPAAPSPAIIKYDKPPAPILDSPLPSHKGSWLVLLLIFLTIFSALGYYGYQYYVLGKPLPSPLAALPHPSTAASPAPVASVAPHFAAENTSTVAYVRDPDPNNPKDYEVWLLDPKDGAEHKLDLGGAVFEAYKYYGSPYLFYKPEGDRGEYRIRDLAEGTEKSVFPITHADPQASENIRIQNLREISPDGKYFIFSADFFSVCPSPSPFPSGFEGGFGPCGPDESLETPAGYYLYDVDAAKSVFLGGLIRVSRWDTDNHKLYYTTSDPNNQTKLLDLVNKTTAYVDATQEFGYFTYPILKTKQLVKMEAATGTSGKPAFAKIFLVEADGKTGPTLESADDWAILQPFFWTTPDDQYVILDRTFLVPPGIRATFLESYNLQTKELKRVTPENNELNYSIYGDWLDDHTFLTSVSTLTQPYTNTNNYLVKIDVTKGTVTRVTAHDKVYRFNLN